MRANTTKPPAVKAGGFVRLVSNPYRKVRDALKHTFYSETMVSIPHRKVRDVPSERDCNRFYQFQFLIGRFATF